MTNRNKCLKRPQKPLPQFSMKPQIPGQNKPVARLPYESISHILNSVSINVSFRGHLPSFDDDMKDIDLPDMTLSDNMKQRNSFSLIVKSLILVYSGTIFPKKWELDTFLQILKKKRSSMIYLPISIKEWRTEYPNSPFFFKGIYIYIVKGSFSFTGNAKRVFKAECEDYIVFEGVLFRIKLDKNKSVPPHLLLCIPETFIPIILYQYHDLVPAGQQGVLTTYLALKQKYWFPNMLLCIKKYILSCSSCHSRKEKDSTIGTHYPRIPLSFRPMSEIIADVKHMPPSRLGYSYILLCTCEVSNFVIGIAIQVVTSVTLFEAIFFKIICLFGNPKKLIFD